MLALHQKEFCLNHHKEQETYHYGMDYQLNKNIAAKWDSNKAEAVAIWLTSLTGERIASSSAEGLQRALKNGIILCKAVNAIFPGSVRTINTSAMPFPQRENVAAYLEACKSAGVVDTFMTTDLYEGANMVSVLDQIIALGNLASNTRSYHGPQLKVKDGAVVLQGRFSSPVSTVSVSSSAPSFSRQTSKPFDPQTRPVSKVTNVSVGENGPVVTTTTTYTVVETVKPVVINVGKFCKNCGRQSTGGKFCGSCGEIL